MIQPELFDIVELLVDIPQYHLKGGIQGTVVECYAHQSYEVEFSNSQGEEVHLSFPRKRESRETFVSYTSLIWETL